MTNFMKYLLFIVLFTSHIFACALCKFDVPLLSVEANVTALAKKTHFQIKWHFHPTFIAQLVEYDEDDNGIKVK